MKTIKEAVCEWINEMNAYPRSMIEVLIDTMPADWQEITMPKYGNKVKIIDFPEGCETDIVNGEIYDIDNDRYHIRLDGGNEITLGIDDFVVLYDDYLPMWGVLWSFSDSVDIRWMENPNNIKMMSECGFRIYEHTEWGYFFGIDGAGYDFFENHWIPLYNARGLKWHDETALTDDDVRKMLADCGVSNAIADKLVKMKIGDVLRIGGYYGGHISDSNAMNIAKCKRFLVTEHHEKVQEMSHLEDNNYRQIIRIV